MKTLFCVFAVMLALVLIYSGSVSAAESDMVINEVLVDPPTGEDGDANKDGTRQTYGDEFVELVNRGSEIVNISSWTLSDTSGTAVFTFPEGTTVNPNEFIVLFGGGVPTGFTWCQVFVDDGRIGDCLHNGGDRVELKNASGEIIDFFEYGSEGGQNESLTRYPDGSGPFVKHLSETPSGDRFSPGKTVGGDVSLPVLLSSFEAVSGNGQITLYWVTESEIDNLKFRVWLALEEDGEYNYIGEVEGAGSSASAREYSYEVRGLENGQTYWFKLEDVAFDGTSEVHGPVFACPMALILSEPEEGGVRPDNWGEVKSKFE